MSANETTGKTRPKDVPVEDWHLGGTTPASSAPEEVARGHVLGSTSACDVATNAHERRGKIDVRADGHSHNEVTYCDVDVNHFIDRSTRDDDWQEPQRVDELRRDALRLWQAAANAT